MARDVKHHRGKKIAPAPDMKEMDPEKMYSSVRFILVLRALYSFVMSYARLVSTLNGRAHER